MKQKIGKHRLKLGSQFVSSLTPFEDALNLAAMLRVELRGRRVGAYILTKGNQRDNLRFVFGFDCQGIHNTLTDEQVETIVSQLESGLKDLPAGERLTVHLSSFSSDHNRQQDLTDLARFAPSDALKFLLTAERARVQQLTQQGLRKPKTLRLYVTYTVQSSTEGGAGCHRKAYFQRGNPVEVLHGRAAIGQESAAADGADQGVYRWLSAVGAGALQQDGANGASPGSRRAVAPAVAAVQCQ